MIEISGTIEKIITESNNGRDKKVVTLQAGRNNILFVEFQGKMMDKLKPFEDGDRVEIRLRFNGKTSKLGRNYNNLIGKSIKII